MRVTRPMLRADRHSAPRRHRRRQRLSASALAALRRGRLGVPRPLLERARRRVGGDEAQRPARRPHGPRPARLGFPRARLRAAPGPRRGRLHAGSTVAQRVRGLRLGADDWITKPSHPDEVMARIEAVVRRRRRSQPRDDRGPLVAGEIEIRADQFQAFVAGAEPRAHPARVRAHAGARRGRGRVIEREDIYQHVWGYAMAHGDRSVDVFVRKLRAKLREALARTGGTSTRTSASAIGSIPCRPPAWSPRPFPSRPRHEAPDGFVGEHGRTFRRSPNSANRRTLCF